ncbi:Uncharacterised protein [Streptococcus pneumoniae]|nr:Uncharacterised protein [Streptococcus pneumoniae]CJB02781.1 Uncharacterised protein [Streptococcus pneumoniae]
MGSTTTDLLLILSVLFEIQKKYVKLYLFGSLV